MKSGARVRFRRIRIVKSAVEKARLSVDRTSTRSLEVKGKTGPVSVVAIRDQSAIALH
jgi:hypothetical protein